MPEVPVLDLERLKTDVKALVDRVEASDFKVLSERVEALEEENSNA